MIQSLHPVRWSHHTSLGPASTTALDVPILKIHLLNTALKQVTSFIGCTENLIYNAAPLVSFWHHVIETQVLISVQCPAKFGVMYGWYLHALNSLPLISAGVKVTLSGWACEAIKSAKENNFCQCVVSFFCFLFYGDFNCQTCSNSTLHWVCKSVRYMHSSY